MVYFIYKIIIIMEIIGFTLIAIVAVTSFLFGKTTVEVYFYLRDDFRKSRKMKRQLKAWKMWETV